MCQDHLPPLWQGYSVSSTQLKAGFHITATIATKTVERSLRLWSQSSFHNWAGFHMTAAIATIGKKWFPHDRNDCWTFSPAIAATVVIVAIIWKPAFIHWFVFKSYLAKNVAKLVFCSHLNIFYCFHMSMHVFSVQITFCDALYFSPIGNVSEILRSHQRSYLCRSEKQTISNERKVRAFSWKREGIRRRWGLNCLELTCRVALVSEFY